MAASCWMTESFCGEAESPSARLPWRERQADFRSSGFEQPLSCSFWICLGTMMPVPAPRLPHMAFLASLRPRRTRGLCPLQPGSASGCGAGVRGGVPVSACLWAVHVSACLPCGLAQGCGLRNAGLLSVGWELPVTLTLLVLRMLNMSCKPSVTSSSLYSSSLREPKSRRRLCTTEYRDWEKEVLSDSIQTCSFQGTPGGWEGPAVIPCETPEPAPHWPPFLAGCRDEREHPTRACAPSCVLSTLSAAVGGKRPFSLTGALRGQGIQVLVG